MNLTWASSIFYVLSHKDWLRGGHVTQVESVRAYPGTFPGVTRRKEVLSIALGLMEIQVGAARCLHDSIISLKCSSCTRMVNPDALMLCDCPESVYPVARLAS